MGQQSIRSWATLGSGLSLLLTLAALAGMGARALGQSDKAVEMQGAASAAVPRVNEVRVALIIANEHYTEQSDGKHYPKGELNLPIQDAKRLKKALVDVGFDVMLVQDLADKDAFRSAVSDFEKWASGKDAVAFVYYTGHAAGLPNEEGEHEVFLIPVKLDKPRTEGHLADQSYPLSKLPERLQRVGTRLEIIVVDACQDNPFIKKRKSSAPVGLRHKAVTMSAERMEQSRLNPRVARGTATFYAARAGKTTYDDGLYARAWEAVLKTPGLSLGLIPGRLNDLVLQKGGTWGGAHLEHQGDFVFLSRPPPLQSRLEQLGGSWARLPGGRYERGSTDGDPDEQPVKSVTIPAFEMSTTEITNGMYLACVKVGLCEPPHWDDGTCYVFDGSSWSPGKLPESFRGEHQPVVCVDWTQAQAFATWVGGRLATESEFEYALRGGVQQKYGGTNDLTKICEYANVADQTLKETYKDWMWSIVACRDGHTVTAPVGQFKPNPFGLYDLTGNAWEWVEDCYQSNYEGAPEDGTARTSCSGLLRVLRGGGWSSDGAGLRAADRDSRSPGNRNDDVGFRVVRSAPLSGGP